MPIINQSQAMDKGTGKIGLYQSVSDWLKLSEYKFPVK